MGRTQERHWGKERRERTLAGGPKVPRGFGLRIGDSGDTTDGAGDGGKPASPAQITGKDWELAEPQTSIFPFRPSQYP